MNARYFASGRQFRDWLELNSTRKPDLVLGFYKQTSAKIGITYREALDEALCFGWIDGVRHKIDEYSYTIRFTPRRPRSIWSRLNIGRVRRLERQGRMQVAGLKAFAARQASRSAVYSFENPPRPLSPAFQVQFMANPAAWSFFQARPPWYRRVASWWVMSAKKPETRRRRLATLITDSAGGRTIRLLTRKAD